MTHTKTMNDRNWALGIQLAMHIIIIYYSHGKVDTESMRKPNED